MAKGFKAVKRFTKKELKEDKFVVSYFKARQWMDENQKNVLKIGVASILVIALVTFWFMSRNRAESQATSELSMAMIKGQTGDPQAVTQQLSDLAKRYSGTRAGEEALYYVGQLKVMAHQPDEALKAFDDYVKHGSQDRYLYVAALAGKAAALEDLKRYKEAAETYLKAATTKADVFAYPGFRLDAARCFEQAGDKVNAKEQYQMVMQNHPKTPYAQKAEQGLAQLQAKS